MQPINALYLFELSLTDTELTLGGVGLGTIGLLSHFSDINSVGLVGPDRVLYRPKGIIVNFVNIFYFLLYSCRFWLVYSI